jgi:hypothetical protein
MDPWRKKRGGGGGAEIRNRANPKKSSIAWMHIKLRPYMIVGEKSYSAHAKFGVDATPSVSF